jgi:hypothetical protein
MPFTVSIRRRLDGEAPPRILPRVARREDARRRGGSPRPEDLRHWLDGAGRAECLRPAPAPELDERRRREHPAPAGDLARLAGDAEVARAAFDELTVARTSLSPPSIAGRADRRLEPPPATIGKLEVIGPLAAGGEGRTYRAREPDSGPLVAPKRDHAEADERATARAPLDGQRMATRRTRSAPHRHGVARVGDEVLLVMEYVAGHNLSEVNGARRGRRLAAARPATSLEAAGARTAAGRIP